jgi:predicted ArsR family transcriptional regulator
VTRIDKGIDRDLEILDLIHLFPGVSIGDLANLTGDSHSGIQFHVRNLVQARLIAIYTRTRDTGRSVRCMYPAGVKR